MRCGLLGRQKARAELNLNRVFHSGQIHRGSLQPRTVSMGSILRATRCAGARKDARALSRLRSEVASVAECAQISASRGRTIMLKQGYFWAAMWLFAVAATPVAAQTASPSKSPAPATVGPKSAGPA